MAIVRFLVAQGADIFATCSQGSTAEHFAIARGNTEIAIVLGGERLLRYKDEEGFQKKKR